MHSASERLEAQCKDIERYLFNIHGDKKWSYLHFFCVKETEKQNFTNPVSGRKKKT